MTRIESEMGNLWWGDGGGVMIVIGGMMGVLDFLIWCRAVVNMNSLEERNSLSADL